MTIIFTSHYYSILHLRVNVIKLLKNNIKILAYKIQQMTFPLLSYPFVTLITVLTTHVLQGYFNDSF